MSKKEELLEQEQPVEETQDVTAEQNEEASNAEEAGKEDTQVLKLEQEVIDLKDKYLRLLAEFDNYKKRTAKEKLEMISTAATNTIKGILPVADDFNRAITSAESADNDEQISDGLLLTINRLFKALEDQGVVAMESNGEPFNADLHDALTEIPAPTEELKGKVIDTIEKGYFLNEKLIRHAKVVVGK